MLLRILAFIFILGGLPASLKADDFLMQQRWENLLMVHWEVPAVQLRPHIPKELEILTFKGKAYVGAVALDMVSGNFVRFGDVVSEIPLYRSFGQLNLRTYVKYKGKTGVHFFNLFANHLTTVATGNLVFGLPYQHAKIQRSLNHGIRDFNVAKVYRAKAVTDHQLVKIEKGSLEYFLTEHTLYFQVSKTLFKTCIHTGELWHKPWELSSVKVPVKELNYFRLKGIPLEMKPLATGLYSQDMDVYFYAPKKTCY